MYLGRRYWCRRRRMSCYDTNFGEWAWSQGAYKQGAWNDGRQNASERSVGESICFDCFSTIFVQDGGSDGMAAADPCKWWKEKGFGKAIIIEETPIKGK